MADPTDLSEKPHVYVPPGEMPPLKLMSEDVVEGDGPTAASGDTVDVHYVGVSWKTRKQFDASWDRGETFSFRLGAGMVISGWDEGVQGMKVGGRRRLVLPPDKAYGKQGAGGVIGPNETLVFVVDLLGIR
jgi:peptidylprolyl isomerase